MKLVVLALVSLPIFFSPSPLRAESSDPKKCMNLGEDSKRLECFDDAFRVKSNSKVSDILDASIVDVMADFTELKGKTVKTRGVLLMMGQQGVLYAHRGDMTALFVDIGHLSKISRHDIFDKCGSGCDVILTGKIQEQMMNPGLEAVTLEFQ